MPNKHSFSSWGARSAFALTLLAGAAGFSQAQDWYHQRPDRHEDSYRGDRGYDRGRRMVSPVDATIRDLERAASRNGGYVSHRERSRFDNAMRHLSEFQDRYYRGRFDRDRLDRAIDDVNNVVRHNPLDRYERDRLWNDLNNLRAFRANPGYGDYRRD